MTVRALKNIVLRESGVKNHFAFNDLSRSHYDFWSKLNRLGMRGMPVKDEYMPPDIDEAAILSDAEAEELVEEFRRLHRG